MKRTYLSLFIGFFLFTFSANAQTFEDLKTKKDKNHFEEGWVKVLFRYTSTNGKYAERISSPTANVTFRSDRYKKGGLRYSFESAVFGDLFIGLGREIRSFNGNASGVNKAEQMLTSGWLGWHKLAINVLSKDRLLVAPGISFGDHMIESITYPSSGEVIQDPAGYYFFAGPYVMVSYVINKRMWVDAYINYDITFNKAKNPPNYYVDNPGYPLPTVFFIGVDVYTTSKLFTGIRIAKLKDTGSYKNYGSRVDFSLGFNF